MRNKEAILQQMRMHSNILALIEEQGGPRLTPGYIAKFGHGSGEKATYHCTGYHRGAIQALRWAMGLTPNSNLHQRKKEQTHG